MDGLDKKIMLVLQEGLPITARPYRSAAERLGMSEDEFLARIKNLREKDLIKRVDFSLDMKKLGIVSTLVGCEVSEEHIEKADQLLSQSRNVSHNYLRVHPLNMWFTVSAGSLTELRCLLNDFREKIPCRKMVSLETKDLLKLRFHLHAQ